MIIDSYLEFSDSGDFANEPGTANVGDVIDLGPEGRNIAAGTPMAVVIVVETAADGGATNTATIAFRVVSDSTDTPTTDGTESVHAVSKTFTAATELTAGTKLAIPLQIGDDFERYLGLQIVTAVEGEDDLVCSAFLTPFHQVDWRAYADATN